MIKRLVCAIALALFALLSVSMVHAAAPVPFYTVNSGGFNVWAVDQASACSSFATFMKGKPDGTGFTFTGEGAIVSGLCRVYKKDGTGYQSWSISSIQAGNRCAPAGSAPDTSKPLAQQCPDTCAKDVPGPTVNVTIGWKTGPDDNSAWAKQYGGFSAGCDGSCTYSVESVQDCFAEKSPIGGYYRAYCLYKTMYSGGTCSSSGDPNEGKDPPSEAPPEKNRCPLGTSQIGVDSDGIPICRGDKPDTDPKKETKTTTTTNADGSKTITTTETTTNSDGSITTKTTTKTTNADGSDGGTKESTTTGNKPDGTKGTSDSTDKDQADLCKQHPTLTICRNSQISGTCRSVSCDGDAIQCAIARKQAEDSCKRQEDEDAVKASDYFAKGQAAKNGDMTGLPTKDNAEQISVGSLDASGWMGGGNCFADKTIQTAAGSFVIPLSQACDVLVLFRYLFMFVASMVSFGILNRSFLGS